MHCKWHPRISQALGQCDVEREKIPALFRNIGLVRHPKIPNLRAVLDNKAVAATDIFGHGALGYSADYANMGKVGLSQTGYGFHDLMVVGEFVI